MEFREILKCEKHFNTNKLIDELREELLRKKPCMQILKAMFEMLFNENIKEGLMRVFERRFMKLTFDEKNSFTDNFLERYYRFGEFGFATIVLQPLSRVGS